MEFKVGVGKSDFADLRKSDNYYVDKTEILYELVHDTDNKVTLFTRRRLRRYQSSCGRPSATMIITKIITMLFWPGHLSDWAMRWSPIRRKDLEGRIFY